MELGIRWRVGDGSLIRVWRDKWLPQPYSFRPATTNLFLPDDFLVENLIDKEQCKWRTDLLEVLFMPRDVEQISQIPLST